MNPQRPFYAQGSSNSPAQSPSFSQNGSPIPAQHFGSPSFQQQVIEFQRSQQLLAQQGLLNSQGGNPGRQNVPPGQNGMNFPGLQGMQGLPGMQGMQGIQGMPGMGGRTSSKCKESKVLDCRVCRCRIKLNELWATDRSHRECNGPPTSS